MQEKLLADAGAKPKGKSKAQPKPKAARGAVAAKTVHHDASAGPMVAAPKQPPASAAPKQPPVFAGDVDDFDDAPAAQPSRSSKVIDEGDLSEVTNEDAEDMCN